MTTIEELLEAIAARRDAITMLDKEGASVSKARKDRTKAFTAAWDIFGYDRTGFVACRYGQLLEFARAEGGYSLQRSPLLAPPLTDDAWEALPEATRRLKEACSSFLMAEERGDVADADYEDASALVEAAKARLQPLMEALGAGQYLCGDRVLSIRMLYGEYECSFSRIL